jgi:hypothetical protein
MGVPDLIISKERISESISKSDEDSPNLRFAFPAIKLQLGNHLETM